MKSYNKTAKRIITGAEAAEKDADKAEAIAKVEEEL